MAGEKPTTESKDELHEKAFEIYSAMVAKSPTGRGGEQQARAAYRKAEAFLAVRDGMQSGTMKASKTDGPVLADCCAPNLHRTHPYNLVSQRFGDLAKVGRIKKWLDANPTPERDPEELVGRLKEQFPELVWDTPPLNPGTSTINIARAIFPAYCTN
jgi:hypothetical protein